MKGDGRTFWWRGALGGAAGGLLWVLLLPAFARPDAYTQYARLLAILLVAPFSTVIGMLVEWVLMKLDAKAGKSYGVFRRAAIGAACSTAAALIIWAGVNAIRTDEQPLVWSTKYWLLFGTLVGGLAGSAVASRSAPR